MQIVKSRKKYLVAVLFLFLSLSSASASEEQRPAGKNTATTNKTECLYQGSLTGYWSGVVMTMEARGTFTAVISADCKVSGTYEGFESGTITGTVTNTGYINASGTAYVHSWKGQVNRVNGRLSGDGVWTGMGVTGSWEGR